MEISKVFTAAVADYQFLLDQKYPQKSVLKLVGDRYALSAIERSILYRGISARNDAEFRRSKLDNSEDLRENSWI